MLAKLASRHFVFSISVFVPGRRHYCKYVTYLIISQSSKFLSTWITWHLNALYLLVWSNWFGRLVYHFLLTDSSSLEVCVCVCCCVHVYRRVCRRVCLSSVWGTECILRSKERYVDAKKAHLCNTHADTQCHTHVHTTISTCKKKRQRTYKVIPPSELFKCNIVKFEPVLGCGYSW